MRQGFRWGLLLGGVALSVALTAMLWWLTGSFVGAFVFLPFLFGFRFLGPNAAADRPADRQAEPTCPRCGHVGAPADRYCPRDGTPLAA